MSKLLLRAGALAALLLAVGLTFAAAPPPSESVLPPMDSHLDYVFLASDRPVLLRFHLEGDGRPYYDGWQRFMRKWFANFDRNNDGWLSKEEVEGRVPNPNYMRNQMRGSIGQPL